MLKRLLNPLADFLFPPVCHICGTGLAPGEKFACTRCMSGLPRSGYHRREDNPVEQSLAGLIPFEKATGYFLYTRESPLATLVQDMKYRGFPDIGRVLGHTAAAELFASGFFSGADTVVPVPMHWLKRGIRGYNQAENIAEGVAEAAMLTVSNALKAVRPHRTQTSVRGDMRRSNTEGIFRVSKPEDVRGKHIVLVDDICTTGATLASAAEAIREAGPSAITILALASAF